ncbi:MAG TPA: hypothetical protein VJY62_02520 [Bacteroidia bacterium]|nr:hypothetical protein [Bacteroidia bacterium]
MIQSKLKHRRPVEKVKPTNVYYFRVMDGTHEGKILEGFTFRCKYDFIDKVRCKKTGLVLPRGICMRQGKVDLTIQQS